MLKRKMTDQLLNWKRARQKTHTKQALLVKGARQVGKTYTITQFGETAYDSFIALNFIEHPELTRVFEGPLTPQEIKERISLFLPDASFIAGDTLLFLDEIQECSKARTALKFLAQDPDIDVIASGSLLGLNYMRDSSIPVGYEMQVEMFGLDFEEFLWALGLGDAPFDAFRRHLVSLEPFNRAILEKYLRHFRQYIAVGGMPAVVATYVDSLNYGKVHEAQTQLLNTYLDDIAKFADANVRNKARECYLSVPRQLAKENTKFRYGLVEKKGTARKFETALDWLRDANLVRYCHAVKTPEFPLMAYEDESKFRLYLNDTGLLCAMYGFEMMAAVIEDTLQGPMKGGIYENAVACSLVKTGLSLHYWVNPGVTQEIEFLLDRNAGVVPVEVKASRGATVSLDAFLERPEVKVGYKLHAGNAGEVGKKVSLPYFMTSLLAEVQTV